MDHVRSASAARPDSGYAMALGYLQIGTGSLTLLMSLMALFQVMLGLGAVLDPSKVFGLSTGLVDQAISAYVSLQLGFGWIAGALQLAAGVRCLNGGGRRFVAFASFVSLINFPHGTLAAMLMLLALYDGALRTDASPEVSAGTEA